MLEMWGRHHLNCSAETLTLNDASFSLMALCTDLYHNVMTNLRIVKEVVDTSQTHDMVFEPSSIYQS
jgi:hypothetical protein